MITIAKYGNRFWAVYRNDELICVTVYKRGAVAVRDALYEALSQQEAPHAAA